MKKYAIWHVLGILFLGILSVGCTEEKVPEYVPADLVSGAQVYFMDAPTSVSLYEIVNKDLNSFTLKLGRGITTSETTVNIAHDADGLFNIPSSVSFPAGTQSVDLTISFEKSKLVSGTNYPISITLSNDTTPYGASSVEINATYVEPEKWIKFATGTMTEVWWGEVEQETLYYQDLGDGLRYCYITDCFDTMGDAVPTNYYFYWDTNTNYLDIPMQYMGYSNANGDVYFSDASNFYQAYYPDRGKEWADGLYDDGEVRPYYDGNGGFYLANYYYFGPAGCTNWGRGYNWGDDQDYFICDGYVRIVDYNTAFEYKALYEGTLSSLMLSEDGVNPVDLEQSLRVQKEYDPEEDETCIYYFPNYFNEGSGIAFRAPIPEKLEDGAEIEDVDNDQYVGVKIFGNPLYVQVKSGSVSFPEDGEGNVSEFPSITINYAVYTKDEEGNKTYDFGRMQEVFTAEAYGKDNYTYNDIVGIQKKYYIGDFNIVFKDFFEGGEEYVAPISIEDAGVDADGAQWLKIINLSGMYGFGGTFDDGILAEWYNGYLYIEGGQQTASPLTYQGTDYPTTEYTFDPDAGSYNTVYLLGGYVEDDDVIAFVGYPNYESYRGMYFVANGLGGLAAIYDIVAYWPEDESVSARPLMDRKKTFTPAPLIQEMMRATNARAAKRQFNTSSAVKVEKGHKNISEPTSVSKHI